MGVLAMSSFSKATPHRRNLSGIVENMIRFTYE